MINKDLKKLLYSLLSVVIFIVVWFVASAAVSREYILPSPFVALKAFLGLITASAFYGALLASLLRTLISFCAAFVFALILAVLAAIFPKLSIMLSPLITILRATPTISIILIALIWLKSNTAPMLIAFLIIFPTLYASIYGAVCSVDKELIQMSRVYKVSRLNMLKKLYIPSVLPALFVSAKSNISLNLKIIIASEVLAATRISMGYEMQLSKLYLETPTLLAWTIAAVLLGYVLETAVELIKRRAIRWQV